MATLTLADIADKLGAELIGEGDLPVDRIGTIQSADGRSLTFLANPHYRSYLANTQAAAVLCRADMAELCPVPALVVKDPYLAYAQISHLFDQRPVPQAGVHPTAVVADDVQVPANAHIGAQVVIEKGVKLADGVIIMAGCYIAEDCQIGENTRIWPHVVLYHGTQLGARVTIHANTVIGADGFGFAPSAQGWQKVAQLGRVVVDDDVDIGAGTTIDRGAVDDTRIGQGVIIDNQVQVGHNVEIGDHTALAGKVGIAGSAKIGRFCMLGGAVGVSGHIEICDKVQLLGMTLVTGNITEPGAYASATPADKQKSWQRNVVRFRHLDDMYRRVRRLEKQRASSEAGKK